MLEFGLMAGKEKTYLTILTLIAIALGAGLGYTYVQADKLSVELEKTKTEFASSTESFKAEVAKLNDELSKEKDFNDELNDELNEERERNDDFEDQIKDISKTVTNLDKLSKTDKELLQKYSKVYFLNEHYVPDRLVKIDSEYNFPSTDEEKIHANVLPFLERLLNRAERDGHDLKIISAYRSFSEQAVLKSGYKVTYGAGTANQFSADQGYSEHQLGTTVDLTTTALGNAFEGIDKTEAYKWLLDNAHRYGFVLSYPENNAYYQFEPWHWRFVGEELAAKLHKDDDHFYDVEQREIDKYLIVIFD